LSRLRGRRAALTLAALSQLAIGAAAIFARFALHASGPLAVSAARLCVAALPLVVLAALRGRLRASDAWTERRLGVAGVLLAIHFATWIASLNFASVAISTLLVCTTPLWTEAYAVVRRRRVDALAALGIAGALAGVAIVVGAPERTNAPLGIALALAGGVAFAAYLIIVRGVDARYDTLAVTSRTYAYAALLLTAAALAAHDHLPAAGDARAWGGILAMALFSQLFGHTALNAAVRVLSATLVSTMTLLEPVFAAVLAAWLFDERLGATTAVGAAIIFVAIGIALRAEACGIDTADTRDTSWPQALPERTRRVMGGRGRERNAMLAATPHWIEERLSLDGPVEIVPPYWVDDDEIVALERQHEPFSFERFADGTLLVSPPAGWKSGSKESELNRQVANWVRDCAPGALTMASNGGVKLPDRSLLAPDATYVSAERWARSDSSRTFAEVVPDAAFEVLSPSDRIGAAHRKIAAYVRNGVRLAVLIDPIHRRISVGREGDAEPRDLGDVDRVDCSPVMPGFVLDVDAIVRDA